MWVARDKDYDLSLFTYLPKRCKDYGGSWEAADCEDSEYCGLNKKLFPELKWEDEPLEVCLCINNEKYHTVKIEELNRLYNIDWSYQDMKETLETYFDMVGNYRKLPWYKRIFTNI